MSIFGVILVRVFPAFGLNTEYLSVFSPNAENADQNNCEYGHFLSSDTQ